MKRDYNKSGELRPFRGCRFDDRPLIQPVIPNQAVTPAEMLDLAKQGIPISADSAGAVHGELNPSWNLPLEKTKHIDPAELWQAQQSIKSKVRKMHDSQKKAELLAKYAND